MVATSDIIAFASGFVGKEVLCEDDANLLAAMDIGGDEAQAFFAAYARHFVVDITGMLWFFHYKSDGSPFYRRIKPVDREGRTFAMIPVTPRLLADAATLGQWPLEYPEHQVHVSRWPAALMFTLLATLVLAITFLFIE